MSKLLLVGAPFIGAFLASLPAAAAQVQSFDFRVAAVAINDVVRVNHYHRSELDKDQYREIEKEVIALGERSTSSDEFVNGFNAIWRKGPFSHVGLQKAEGSAADRIASLDTLIVGPNAVKLAWHGSIAILTVNTMTGADTIKAIDAAYREIAARRAEKLIIDLRQNDGGAFAVVPLIGHLIDKPIDAGVFAVSSWYDDHGAPPSPADFRSATPWRGYSVKAFQADIMTRPLTSYRIDPMEPLFQGPVFVLTSSRSISAAEIAADALKSIGRATVIGEKTPGVVLSSSLFDIPGGLHLRVPIADYYSIRNGRLEGVGVPPDIAVSAERALDVALSIPQKAAEITGQIDQVELGPVFAERFLCVEHALELEYAGDALGTDCMIGGGSGLGIPGFLKLYRTDGKSNADWYGWRANVLAPFEGTVIHAANPEGPENAPGVLGSSRGGGLRFRNAQGVIASMGHVTEIAVKAGDTVKAGQVVAKVGNNGQSKAPHVHIGAYRERDLIPLQIRWDLRAMAKARAQAGIQ